MIRERAAVIVTGVGTVSGSAGHVLIRMLGGRSAQSRAPVSKLRKYGLNISHTSLSLGRQRSGRGRAIFSLMVSLSANDGLVNFRLL